MGEGSGEERREGVLGGRWGKGEWYGGGEME